MRKIINYLKPLSIALLLAWLVSMVLARANPYLTLPSADGGSFLYIGSRMLAGDELYVDVWDHKGPGIFFVNWLGLLLVNNSRWGVWFIEFFTLYLGFLFGYIGLKKRWGEGAALVGLVFSAYSLENVFEKGNLTEEYPLLFNFFALWLFFTQENRRPYLTYTIIGLTFGAAFLFRANNGGVQVAIGLSMLLLGLLRREFSTLFKQLAGLATGTLAALLFTTLFFYQRGTLQAFIDAAFTYNLLDVSGSLDIFSGVLTGWEFFNPAIYVMTVAYLAVWYQLFLLIKDRQWDGVETEPLVLMAVLWPLEAFLSSLSGRNYSHYFVCWVPAIFLLTSYAYRTFAPIIFSNRVITFLDTPRARFAILLISMAFSLTIVRDYAQTFHVLLFQRQFGIDKGHEVAAYIRENTSPDDKVLIWGWGAGMNFISRRQSPTSHIFYPLPSENPVNALLSRKFYEDLANNKPVLVVDMSSTNPDYLSAINPTVRAEQWPKHVRNYYPPYYEEVLDYINRHYRRVKTIKGYEIYRIIEP